MKNENVNRVTKALNLNYPVIGAKFIYYKQEYDAFNVPALEKKLSVCGMSKQAFDGNVFKATSDRVSCIYGGYAIGAYQPSRDVLAARGMNACGLYNSTATSKEVLDGMKYLNQDLYGLLMGPLDQLPDADVVIILGTAYQVMRAMQGYSYNFGNPKNLCSIGNQAMCSDLIAKPYTNNDLNVSFMCKGARLFTQCTDGELAIGLPIHMFDLLVDGIIMTLNPVLEKKQKEELLQRLDTPDELGVEIDASWTYSTRLKDYNKWLENITIENEKDM